MLTNELNKKVVSNGERSLLLASIIEIFVEETKQKKQILY